MSLTFQNVRGIGWDYNAEFSLFHGLKLVNLRRTTYIIQYTHYTYNITLDNISLQKVNNVTGLVISTKLYKNTIYSSTY